MADHGTALATTTSLRDLLRAGARSPEIARHLDGLAPPERLRQVLAVRGSGVARLYEAVEGAPPIALAELVPEERATPLVYEGRNSLLLFSRFQKRFARVDGTIVGYNHQPFAFITGPGFFVVRAPAADGPHPGEMLFDYTAAPPGVPAGFPAYKPNDRGLSRLVYMGMHDWVRRVARGVVVGKAFSADGADRKAWFSLTLAD
jgi:hypothetical protein